MSAGLIGPHSAAVAALIALSEGKPIRASKLAKESLALFREMDARWDIAMTLYVLGQVEAQRSDLGAARSHYEESLALSRELGEQFIIPLSLEGLAGVLVTQGESDGQHSSREQQKSCAK